ncbi:MAG: hypothetical protein LBT00_09525 [Spirochaetaceae bacterium]|nr:hypothetical protein [Spirochaetaceae bacterium]
MLPRVRNDEPATRLAMTMPAVIVGEVPDTTSEVPVIASGRHIAERSNPVWRLKTRQAVYAFIVE